MVRVCHPPLAHCSSLLLKAPMYYRGANAALLLYDITNRSTFLEYVFSFDVVSYPLLMNTPTAYEAG